MRWHRHSAIENRHSKNPMVPLRVESVSKGYGVGTKAVRALDDVSMQVLPGEFVGIVGRSGSGKSTLLNLLAGLDRPTRGAIWVGDSNLVEMSSRQLAQHRQQTVGIVFQFFYLVPTMVALENVMLSMAFAGISSALRKEKAESLLEDLGLGERMDHLPSELSGGEQQRVALARALTNDPDFLLADEPTGNLDSATTEQILEIFGRVHQQGRTVICVTHEEELISELSTRMVRLKDGRIVVE